MRKRREDSEGYKEIKKEKGRETKREGKGEERLSDKDTIYQGHW